MWLSNTYTNNFGPLCYHTSNWVIWNKFLDYLIQNYVNIILGQQNLELACCTTPTNYLIIVSGWINQKTCNSDYSIWNFDRKILDLLLWIQKRNAVMSNKKRKKEKERERKVYWQRQVGAWLWFTRWRWWVVRGWHDGWFHAKVVLGGCNGGVWMQRWYWVVVMVMEIWKRRFLFWKNN